MRTSATGVYAIGDCAAVEGRVFAYIEPIRRQAQTIASDLRGTPVAFDSHPPLVRVKTPSFPLTVCPPDQSDALSPVVSEDEPGRIAYYDGERLAGFVLSEGMAGTGANLYRDMIG